MKIHDSGYKTLLRNRTIFRQLIETFVDEPWVKDLDFSQAETVETSFVADDYKHTESDLIYRLNLHGRDIYFYILLEFQSTIDPWMALRIANYVTNFYMSLVKARKEQKRESSKEKLPAVFPLMLYNGDEKWTAATSLAELIEDVPDLGEFGIKCKYLKIAENEFSKETLLKIRNIVSTLFLAEAHYDIDLLIDEMLQVFRTEEDRQAVNLLINWFRQLAVHGRIESNDFSKVEEVYRSVEETRSMLITAIAKEREEILQEGIVQGIEQGREEGIEQGREEVCGAMQATIEELIIHRFGATSDEIRAGLKACTLEQLKGLVNPALNAPDINSFLAQVTLTASENNEESATKEDDV